MVVAGSFPGCHLLVVYDCRQSNVIASPHTSCAKKLGGDVKMT